MQPISYALTLALTLACGSGCDGTHPPQTAADPGGNGAHSSTTSTTVPTARRRPHLPRTIPLRRTSTTGKSSTSTTATTATTTTTTTISEPPPAPSATNCGYSEAQIQESFLKLVNQVRATGYVCGGNEYAATRALAWDVRLATAASEHSDDLAKNKFMSHIGSDRSSPSDRMRNAGYNWTAAGENIASGFITIESVMQGWLDSPEHCEAIMTQEFRDIGVACTRGSVAGHNPNHRYWTMDFGRR